MPPSTSCLRDKATYIGFFQRIRKISSSEPRLEREQADIVGKEFHTEHAPAIALGKLRAANRKETVGRTAVATRNYDQRVDKILDSLLNQLV